MAKMEEAVSLSQNQKTSSAEEMVVDAITFYAKQLKRLPCDRHYHFTNQYRIDATAGGYGAAWRSSLVPKTIGEKR
jgi:hypothetical protein